MRTLMLLGLFATACDDKADDSGSSGIRDCAVVQSELTAAFAAVQSCTTADECGQPILGTSCGCTQNKVARTDADLSTVEALMEEGGALECDLGLTSDCSCPEADGYDCIDDACTWNYVR